MATKEASKVVEPVRIKVVRDERGNKVQYERVGGRWRKVA